MFKKKLFELEDISLHLDEYLRNMSADDENKVNFEVLIRSNRVPLDYSYATSKKNTPFHISGIGKIFTATLISLLVDQGKLQFKDPISKYLSNKELDSLFIVGGVDYSAKVTIEQLLAHTSGIADYFQGPVLSGIPFKEDVFRNRNIFWKPEMLLNFSRINQVAVAKPGEKFSYSETGYVLLGRLIEKITGKSYADNVTAEFFLPLGMNDSYFLFTTEPLNQPKNPIEFIYLDGVEISTIRSLSFDSSGGGIISTTEDLIRFYEALRHGKLIKKETLYSLENFTNKYKSGIYYGLGMMEVHFEDFLILLKELPRVTGHIGSFGTQLFHDAQNDAYIVLNLSSSNNVTKSFRVLVEIENTIRKYNKSKSNKKS
ncbi:MAG: serine hydrolase domain-containing protein [Clostridiaceae bacterium]